MDQGVVQVQEEVERRNQVHMLYGIGRSYLVRPLHSHGVQIGYS